MIEYLKSKFRKDPKPTQSREGFRPPASSSIGSPYRSTPSQSSSASRSFDTDVPAAVYEVSSSFYSSSSDSSSSYSSSDCSSSSSSCSSD